MNNLPKSRHRTYVGRRRRRRKEKKKKKTKKKGIKKEETFFIAIGDSSESENTFLTEILAT